MLSASGALCVGIEDGEQWLGRVDALKLQRDPAGPGGAILTYRIAQVLECRNFSEPCRLRYEVALMKF